MLDEPTNFLDLRTQMLLEEFLRSFKGGILVAIAAIYAAAGMLGLVQAARTFDPTHGVPFDRHAANRIRGALLDELDKGHDFPLPPKMVDAEFEGIWSQVQADKEAGKLPEEDAKKSEKPRTAFCHSWVSVNCSK